jgi:hypothetical protein
MFVFDLSGSEKKISLLRRRTRTKNLQLRVRRNCLTENQSWCGWQQEASEEGGTWSKEPNKNRKKKKMYENSDSTGKACNHFKS